MSKTYDIVILGGGTGGYVAAIRAAQLGKTVAVVEKDKLGGTCLHRGCIPSKSLLRSAELYSQMKRCEEFGIEASDVTLRFDRIQARKQRIVDQLHQGVQFLMKKNKIDVFNGNGRIIGPSIFSPRSGAIAVELADGGEVENLVPQHLIIATGSKAKMLPDLKHDGIHVLNSDDALQLDELPGSMLIIGGGVIGVEWASMLNDFGVKVTVLEYDARLVPTEDEEISKELEKQFGKRGIQIVTRAKVFGESLDISGESVSLNVEVDGREQRYSADKVLVAVGRNGNTQGIGLENTDVRVERGFIQVNEWMQTSEEHIYAIGDVIGGLQLAHAASHEGMMAVEHICGMDVQPMQAHLIPRCIYTRPEIASVGWTEQQAKERGLDVRVGKFPFSAVGKALVYGEAEGFVKVVADRRTNDIVGVHIIGPHATDSISEAALAQMLDATPWEVGRTIHPHPTISEALSEAMLASIGQTISI